MALARLGLPEDAVDVLTMPVSTNQYLANGHLNASGRSGRDGVAVFLPANGMLLAAVGLMLGGWDGSARDAPGFPTSWPVRHEGFRPFF